MKAVHGLMAGLLSCGLIAAAPLSQAQMPEALSRGFTADVVNNSEIDGRPMVMKGKIYVSNDKMRMESNMEIAGKAMNATVITRVDKNVVWTLMPQQNMYTEFPVKPADAARVTSMATGWAGKTPVGQQTIDGQPTDKYEQTSDNCTVYNYVSKSTQLPVKAEVTCEKFRGVTDFKNVQVGEPAAGLFEVPAGYQKLDAGGLMKMGAGMFAGGDQ